jgi:protein-S-isoprenylcysteine O-methyltransferase Ste14
MEFKTHARWFAVCRTCIFVVFFIGTVGIYLPRYLGLLSWGLHSGLRLTGAILLAVGAYVAIHCAFTFAWTGRGTPAPFDPPRQLVITGWYRYVRNPVYFGMALFLTGEFLLWGSNPRGALAYLVTFGVAATLFVLLYEEPVLRRKFPERLFGRSVPRFLPRLSPWNPERSKGANSAD